MHKFLTFIEKFTLDVKLAIGFSSGIVIAAVIGIYSVTNLLALKTDMEKMYELDLMGISHIKEANINLIYMGRAMRQMLIAQDDIGRDKARAQVIAARQTLTSELDEARKLLFRDEAIVQYEQFKRNFKKYNENLEHALALIEREKTNTSAAAQFLGSPAMVASVNAADDDLAALTKIKERGSKASIDAATQRADDTRLAAVFFIVLGVALAAGLGVLIGSSIKRPNDRLRASVEELAAGKTDSPIPHVDYPNEIGILARAIAVLQEIYRKSNEQHWVKTHGAEISAQLQRAEDFPTLTQTAVSRLAPVVGAGHAAFYVNDAQGQFNLLASYGYRERKSLSNSFRVGEGLVGQCAMEKATILLTAPRDYIRISSGLGEGPPACVMVLPIIHAERVLGVLEMASFQAFTEREKAVLDALLPALATSMEILDRNQRTKELLAATQQQAERMEKQAAQMEEQTVEMEAQQAELLETENWFRSIIETAPDGMLVVDAAGRILLANPQAGHLFGYAPGELVGTDFAQRMPMLALNGDSTVASHAVAGHCKDGSSVVLDASCSPLPDRGGRGKCVSVTVQLHVPAGRQAA
jgi:PAS domain S-box-containing protein